MHPQFQPFADELRALLPHGCTLVDAHTHLGNDEDGMQLSADRLSRMLDDAGVERACVFPLHDPEREPAYRVPNDRVLAWAEQSNGRFVPFCRLDPTQRPRDEAERCLAAGARGIKLHPRAQGFDFGHSALADIFAIAHEHRVPILIHAGRGLAPIAPELCALALRVPATLILAHAAIADMGTFTTRLADHPAAFFDTSVFGTLDLSELFSRVPVERILFASDPPYGRPLAGAYATARVARHVGVDDDGMRALMGGNMARILAADPPRPPSRPARERRLVIDGALARVYTMTMLAMTHYQAGDPTGGDWALELAQSACREPRPHDAAPTVARIAHCLDAARSAVGSSGSGPLPLLWMASVLAVSEGADRLGEAVPQGTHSEG